jgi:hypothetical protein
MGAESSPNYFLNDPVLMRYNPAYAKYYSNFLWGDIGASTVASNDGDGQFAGFNFEINKKLTVGAILARNDFKGLGISGLGLTNSLVSALNGIPSTTRNAINLDNNFELLGAYSLSDATIIGFGASFASTHNNSTPASGTTDKSTASQVGFSVGIIQHLSKDNAFDACVDMIFGNAQNEATKINKVSASTIGASVRFFHNMGKGFSFVPIANFYTQSGTIDAAGFTSDLEAYSNLGFGTGINYTVGDLFLAGGISFIYENWTEKATVSTPELGRSDFCFPQWNLGAEINLTDWMKARLGYVAGSNSHKQDLFATVTTKDQVSISTFNRTGVTLGLGFKFGNFNLDATVNDEVLRQGFRNLSSGTVNTFGYVSASYAF